MLYEVITTECNSVGGWVMELMEHIPEKGEKVEWGIFAITVLDVEEQRIRRLHLEIKDENQQAIQED